MGVETLVIDVAFRGRNMARYLSTRIYGPTTMVETRIYYQNIHAPITITLDNAFMPPPPQTITTSSTTAAKAFATPATVRDRIMNLHFYDNKNENTEDK